MRAHEPTDFLRMIEFAKVGVAKDTVVVRFRPTGTSRRSLALND
jgi:hypothetical protein